MKSVPLAFFLALSLAWVAPSPVGAAKDENAANEVRLRELEEEIARRRQAYKQRYLLRRKQIGETVTEPRFEKYLTGFRRRIACSASMHYPRAARGKTYGKMVVTVSVLADGTFEKAHVEQGSGHKALDEGAIDIARQAAPFEPFPPDIQRDTDVLDITRPWTFTFTEGAAAGSDPCA